MTYFHGCYSVGDDRLWGVNRRRKGTTNTLVALKSIRAARPDGAPIYVILDNLSAHTGADVRRWARQNKVELCFTPTYASWANPIEAHLGPLRQFTLANSNHRSHPAQTRALHHYLSWRNANAATPTSSPHNARNAPASAARKASAGADVPSHQQRDQPRHAAGEQAASQPSRGSTGADARAPESLRAESRNRTAAAAVKPKPTVMQTMTVSNEASAIRGMPWTSMRT